MKRLRAPNRHPRHTDTHRPRRLHAMIPNEALARHLNLHPASEGAPKVTLVDLEYQQLAARYAGTAQRLASLDPDDLECRRHRPRFKERSYTFIPGTWFEALRRSEGWSVGELARRAGIDAEEVQAVEGHPFWPSLTEGPPAETLRAVTGVFQVPLDLLLLTADDYATLVDCRFVTEDRDARGGLCEDLREAACAFLPEAGFDGIPTRPVGLIAYLATSNREVAEHVAALAAHPAAFAAAIALYVAHSNAPPVLPMPREMVEDILAERLSEPPQDYPLHTRMPFE